MYFVRNIIDCKIIGIIKSDIKPFDMPCYIDFKNIQNIEMSNSEFFIFFQDSPYIGYHISNNLYKRMMIIISEKIFKG